MPHQKGKVKARRVIGLIERGDLFNSSEEAEKLQKQKHKNGLRNILTLARSERH